ncbi:hypothetical protein ACFOWX_09780 [Sphingorhabdus arenilitoris]|uniref:Uncharacterized protein n=1 Tax=Sphingorhabdus arenilitoris TaxID=1490041 RepID=A0ABV8RH61_9SPHN
MSWLKNLFSGNEGAAPAKTPMPPLAEQLRNYPPNIPPFACAQSALTPAKQDANLTHLLDSRKERLRLITDLLEHNGVDAAAMLDPKAAVSAVITAAGRIDDWLKQESGSLAQILPAAQGTEAFYHYQKSDRAGEDIIFTLAADLALLEGEAVRLRDPRFSWQVNRAKHLARTFHAKRPCLIRPAGPGEDSDYILDFDFAMVDILYDRITGQPPLRHYGTTLGQIITLGR